MSRGEVKFLVSKLESSGYLGQQAVYKDLSHSVNKVPSPHFSGVLLAAGQMIRKDPSLKTYPLKEVTTDVVLRPTERK